MKKKRVLYKYKFYVLTYNGESFELILLSEDSFSDLGLAKCHALSSMYNFDKLTVPVISSGYDKFFHFYHPRYRRWYDNLKDEHLVRLFPWLVPGEDNSSFGSTP